MSNKDYIDRIKNHKVEMDASSWDKMNELLDGVDEIGTLSIEKKKKRRGFWLFLSMGLIGVLSVGYIGIVNFQKTEQNASKSLGDMDIKSITGTLETSELSNNGNEGVVSNVSLDLAADKNVKTEALAFEITNKGQLREGQIKIKDQNFNRSSNRINSKLGQSLLSNLTDSNSDASKNPTSEESENIEGKISQPYSDQILQSNVGQEVLRSSKSGKIEQADNETTSLSQSTEVDDSANDLSRSELLRLQQIGTGLHELIMSLESQDTDVSIEPAKIGPSKWSYRIGLGVAQFNANRGYHIDAGINYQVNKLLGVEAIVGFSRGWDKSRSTGVGFEFEQHIEFSLLIQLHLMNVSKHRLSILIGPGYAIYNGQRLIPSFEPYYDVRNSRGILYQGGIEYLYNIDRKNTLGLRFGVISYDDAVTFLNFKFQRKF